MIGAADIQAIEQAAWTEWPGLRVQWLPTVDSTNTELMRRAAQGLGEPCVLIAGEQTAGRGRMGKPWQTRPEAALTFSIGLPLAPRDWSGLSLVVGIAVVSALVEWARAQGVGLADPQRGAAERLGLKWPNDVWLMDADGRGRKMAGILIETAASSPLGAGQRCADERHVVIGIGLNLLPQEVPAASVPPASVAQWAGVEPTPQAVLQVLLPAVLAAVRTFEAQGFAAYQQTFSAWDLLAGRDIVLSDGRGGECLGVDVQGELLLATADGVVRVGSGEVSVRPAVRAGGG